MKKIFPLVIAVLAGFWLLGGQNQFGNRTVPRAIPSGADTSAPASSRPGDSSVLTKAFEQRRSNLQVEATGIVSRVLADDNDGSRHQRIIVRVSPQQTVLIAHNIDLAPRVEAIKAGDSISFAGEYEWNSQGGVIHWTHRDPAGQHVAGWLEVAGRRYQ